MLLRLRTGKTSAHHYIIVQGQCGIEDFQLSSSWPLHAAIAAVARDRSHGGTNQSESMQASSPVGMGGRRMSKGG